MRSSYKNKHEVWNYKYGGLLNPIHIYAVYKNIRGVQGLLKLYTLFQSV